MRRGVVAVGLLGLLGLFTGAGARRDAASLREIAGVARLSLPAVFEGGGSVDDQPSWSIFHFSTKRQTDWGGYSHYRSVLLLTVFAPDARADDVARGRTETSRRLLRNVEQVTWGGAAVASGASLTVGEGTYARNYVEPAWIVRREEQARRFDLTLLTWKKAHSREEAVRLVEECARSVVVDPKVADRFAAVRGEPRREEEENQRRIGLLRDDLTRRGLAPFTAGEVRRHGDYLYALRTVGWPFFTIGRALGSLGPWTTPERPFALEYSKPAAGVEWPPLFSRERTVGEWRWTLGPSHLLPDQLNEAIARADADPRVVYFYTFTTINLQSSEPQETARELDLFLAAAPKMAEAFRAGRLVRTRPFR